MKLKVIGSSSRGNSYVLQTNTGSLLIEAGVPFKEIQRAVNFDLSSIVGCIISHEHQDHSKGVKEAMKAGIDVFTSKGTAEAIGAAHHRLNIVKAGEQVNAGDFIVLPFSTEHDAAEPLGYLLQYRPTGEKLLFATDTYFIRYRFSGLNYILVECNYCREILEENIEAGRIPEGLKNRLLESHFSLDNVKGFLKANDLRHVRKIALIHLSDGNSDAARMVREIFELTEKDVEIADPGKVIELEMCPF